MSKNIKLIPELRFPEFENDGEWVENRLDTVVNDFIVPMRDKPKNLNGNFLGAELKTLMEHIYLVQNLIKVFLLRLLKK